MYQSKFSRFSQSIQRYFATNGPHDIIVGRFLQEAKDGNVQNAAGKFSSHWKMIQVMGFLAGCLAISPPKSQALTLAELRAQSDLTPERFIRYFADFKFEPGRTVRNPEAFLKNQSGDCDDFAILAADVLREKGYTTRLVAVFMPEAVHVVCYVAETNSYLDYNCRKKASPLVKCEAGLSAMAASVSKSFRAQWRSVSEFTMEKGVRRFVLTEFH